MKLENEFTVPAPIERAWEVLLDVERVAPCLPGAAIESRDGDEYGGSMAIKIGPITQRYEGTVRIEEADAEARRAVMRAAAKDPRGGGTAAATITTRMEAVADGTRVVVATELQITGPAAQFGRGVMQDVSAKMMGRFADCLADEIAQAQAHGPALSAAASGTAVPGHARIQLPEGPAAAAAEVAARGSAAGTQRLRPTADVLDLGEISRDAVLKRAVPAAAALGVLAVAGFLLRRRGRS